MSHFASVDLQSECLMLFYGGVARPEVVTLDFTFRFQSNGMQISVSSRVLATFALLTTSISFAGVLAPTFFLF